MDLYNFKILYHTAGFAKHKSSLNRGSHSPPVAVELAVSELHELSYEVHRTVEIPIEKDEPDKVIGHL